MVTRGSACQSWTGSFRTLLSSHWLPVVGLASHLRLSLLSGVCFCHSTWEEAAPQMHLYLMNE